MNNHFFSYNLIGDKMKKFFSVIGVISILCISFFYTEKMTTVIKEYDDIMIQIKEENKNYKVEAIDAIIKDNTIIPGLKGKQIDEDSSYSKMKRYGKFNNNLIVYKAVNPKISLEDNFDKYVIGGNPSKRMVSFIFLVEKNSKIDNILEILNKNRIVANFFIDGNWLEDNNEKVITLIENGHNIGNLSYDRDYTDSSYPWSDTIIKKIAKQDFSYCYTESEDNVALKLCSLYHNYTIKPTMVIKNNPLKEVQENLNSGNIFSFVINNSVEKELPTIIKYIESKGFSIETLSNHLAE